MSAIGSFEVLERTQFDACVDLARTLSKVFTAAFVFGQPRSLPDCFEGSLDAFCMAEYGDDGRGVVAEITRDSLVVFIIR